MPELPEVETVRRGLVPALEGKRITHVLQQRPDLRFALPDNFANRLTGRRVDRLTRRAKYIRAWLDDGEVLIIHLGMSGRMSIWQPGDNLPRPPVGR
ncbi:MAG: DNA-formamidopyrimidine glycosylase family protein, partial [Alphaproteobacteria bacterium]|nr:DNA-formamidopyrimidine glycosylase family protein [Alphaproteobacteria bacterium]